jgi:hypothetical protein
MKSNTETLLDQANETHSFSRACLATCEELLNQIENARQAVVTEFKETVQTHDRVFQLAMKEAEALAWQTDYPHLVFPMLAAEKAQAVANWQQHQQAVWRGEARLALAA